MKKASLLGVFVLLLAGCGQKGPLYIPQPEKPTPPDASKTAPVPVAPKQEATGS